MSDIYAEIMRLDEQNDFFGIIKKIEALAEPNYALRVQLARAYINASGQVQDDFSLLQKAQAVLDSCALQGGSDPLWLFCKGCALYKEGLVHDSIMRLERAQGLVRVDPGEQGQQELFGKISSMLRLCRNQLIESEFPGVSEPVRQQLHAHIEKHFGTAQKFCTSFKVEVLHILPHEGHDYHLLCSCGLSGRKLVVPKGFDEQGNAHLELALALPSSYEFKQDRARDWVVYLLLSLIEHVITATEFIGFGYYIDNGAPFSETTRFCGAMLTALGDYPAQAQSLILGDGSVTHFFQIIPLLPLELKYRSTHTAVELLNSFRSRGTILTPFYDGRSDVIGTLDVKQL